MCGLAVWEEGEGASEPKAIPQRMEVSEDVRQIMDSVVHRRAGSQGLGAL